MRDDEHRPVEAAVAIVVDNRGLLCAQGILRLMRAMLRMPPGTIVSVLSTDAAAEHDYPAWCQSTGHRFLGHRWESDPDWGSRIVSQLQKRAGSPDESGDPDDGGNEVGRAPIGERAEGCPP